ncbi:MAG TPA: site-2 protease family protein [Alphaproteobacteria bacterium]|nr:site-2 protease family protein [Alphaproteobacteria bacterium]
MDHKSWSPHAPYLWPLVEQEKPPQRLLSRLPVTHLILFMVTLMTTTFYGALHHDVNLLEDPWQFYRGLPFSLTLLAILGTHEFGHYLMSRYHGVAVTLPYFIPAPSFIGTFGAFIRIKSIVPDRRALFDIGVAGPIAGFVVAVPAIVVGLSLSEVKPAADLTGLGLGSSLLFNGLVQAVLGVTPEAYDVILHPIAFAGWIGLFVTALNLIPAGQLDGGHIVYSLCGRWHRWVTLLCLFALVPLGWFWPGWWVWAFVVFWVSGAHVAWRQGLRYAFLHPPLLNETAPLTVAQKMVAAVALVIFLLTFPPVPFTLPFD